MSELERFSISLDKSLLKAFDARNERINCQNRSEAIRDLIRGCLVAEEWGREEGSGAATVTLVYDHHKHELMEKLAHIQHHHGDIVIATTHVHLDHDNCLEVIILRGPRGDIQSLAESLIAVKGVKHGQVVYTTEGQEAWAG